MISEEILLLLVTNHYIKLRPSPLFHPMIHEGLGLLAGR